MKIFIIHGTYGSPKENWFPWLKKELENLGHKVIVPAFPTPKNHSLENWMKTFEPYIKDIDSKTIFVGHSLGPSFILSVLEKVNIKIKACFFAAGFVSKLDYSKFPEFEALNSTFTEKDFNWDKIKSNCNKFFIYHSDNDPYVPLSFGEELAKNLNSKVNMVPNAGHFNKSTGYIKFDLLLEDIKKEL